MNFFKKTSALIFLTFFVFANLFAFTNLVLAANVSSVDMGQGCNYILQYALDGSPLGSSDVIVAGKEYAIDALIGKKCSITAFVQMGSYDNGAFTLKYCRAGEQYVGFNDDYFAVESKYTFPEGTTQANDAARFYYGDRTGKSCDDLSGLKMQELRISSKVVSATSEEAFKCGAALFFTDTASHMDFTDTRNIALNSSEYQLGAKMEKCTDPRAWWRVTMLIDDKYVKDIVPVRSIPGSQHDYPPPVPLVLDKPGKYDFYLDYSTKSGSDADLKSASGEESLHITMNVSKDAAPANGPYVPPPGPNIQATLPQGGYDAEYGGLKNLIGANNIPQFMAGLVKLFTAALGVWAVVHILVSSYRIVMSQGNTEALAKAKKGITWALIGLTAAILAYSIVGILQTVLGVQ